MAGRADLPDEEQSGSDLQRGGLSEVAPDDMDDFHARSVEYTDYKESRVRDRLRSLLDETRHLRGQGGLTGGSARIPYGLLRGFMVIVSVLLFVMAAVVIVRRVNLQAGLSLAPSQGVVQRDLTVESCQAAARGVTDPAATIVTDPPQNAINANQAERRADDVLREHLGWETGEVPALAGGPSLLQATLPDGQQRIVWQRTWVPTFEGSAVDVDDAAEAGSNPPRALVTYLDVSTGNPIVIYEGIIIEDPLLAGCNETVISEFWEKIRSSIRRLGPSIAMIVALAVGGLTLFVWQNRGELTDVGEEKDQMTEDEGEQLTIGSEAREDYTRLDKRIAPEDYIPPE